MGDKIFIQSGYINLSQIKQSLVNLVRKNGKPNVNLFARFAHPAIFRFSFQSVF